MTDQQPAVPAGWYTDPQDPQALRFWNGADWTDRVSGQGQVPAPREPGAAIECFACGRLTAELEVCPACGYGVRQPSQHAVGRVGDVLDVKRWPRRTRALVVADAGETLTALIRSGPVAVPSKDSHVVDRVAGREDLLTGAGMLLDLASRPDELKRLQLPFGGEQLREAWLRMDIPEEEAVAVAIDALWLGESAMLARMPLPPGCVAALDIERALGQGLPPQDERFVELPPGRFGRLVAPTLRWLLAERQVTVSAELRGWLHGFGSHPAARIGSAAFEQGAALDPALVPVLQALPGVDQRTVSAYEQLAKERLPLYAARQAPWIAVVAALARVPFEPGDLVAAQPGLELLDDLIEAGVLTSEHLPVLQATADPSYLTARLAPERLDLQELQELQFTAELDRRARADRGEEPGAPEPMQRRTNPAGITVRDAGERAAQQLLTTALRTALAEPEAEPEAAPVDGAGYLA